MGRIYLPSSEPPDETEQAEPWPTPPGGRIYLPSSTPPAEEQEAEASDGEQEDDDEPDEPEQPDEGDEGEQGDGGQVVLQEPVPTPVARPALRDNKDAWLAYAQSQGWSGDPEQVTKGELIKQYGQQEQHES